VAAVDNTARVAGLVDQGWTALDAGNASSAAGFFEQAASLMPSSVDANYGLGYAYVKQGRMPEAKVRLCKARARAGATDKREIEAVLTGAGLSCE
jgi:Flp pilus assembly protein TadD